MITAIVLLILVAIICYGMALHWRHRAEIAECRAFAMDRALAFLYRANHDLAQALMEEQMMREELQSRLGECKPDSLDQVAMELEAQLLNRKEKP